MEKWLIASTRTAQSTKLPTGTKQLNQGFVNFHLNPSESRHTSPCFVASRKTVAALLDAEPPNTRSKAWPFKLIHWICLIESVWKLNTQHLAIALQLCLKEISYMLMGGAVMVVGAGRPHNSWNAFRAIRSSFIFNWKIGTSIPIRIVSPIWCVHFDSHSIPIVWCVEVDCTGSPAKNRNPWTLGTEHILVCPAKLTIGRITAVAVDSLTIVAATPNWKERVVTNLHFKMFKLNTMLVFADFNKNRWRKLDSRLERVQQRHHRSA